jgi:hypothetical protein
MAGILDPTEADQASQFLLAMLKNKPFLEAYVDVHKNNIGGGAELPLLEALAVITPRLKPDRARAFAGEAVPPLAANAVRVIYTPFLGKWVSQINALSAQVDPPSFKKIARELIPSLVQDPNQGVGNIFWPGALIATKSLGPELAALLVHFEKQELVDQLKNPLGLWAHRILLDELGKRCGREFPDLWTFVEWAHEHEPGLDLDSPFKRPETDSD